MLDVFLSVARFYIYTVNNYSSLKLSAGNAIEIHIIIRAILPRLFNLFNLLLISLKLLSFNFYIYALSFLLSCLLIY